ncbi:Very short patch repair protein [Kushneria phyllosphaerae]|uniref:Very short patch repair endonuclease n=2 Tax=Kushneria phyllosphaerae TaxID=2100822 RepID=A0A2R8CKM0_9GAMM|nr:Very short patch repair protein [Kushneria phyllosphaerae]
MDNISPERRSANMRAIRSKNTSPEMVVRRLLHQMGYRFRLHRKDLPGKPDIVLPKYRTVIFVHGCFWHQHPDPDCKDARLPKSNPDYWLPKLERNRVRDLEHQIKLENEGWNVVVIWACETKLKHSPALVEKLKNTL